jgi:histidinol-phosphate aminotransferase
MPLVPPYIEALRPYEAGLSIDEVRRQFGLDRIVKLASNENPLGPSPLAVEAMQESFANMHRYPNGGFDLRRALADRFDVRVENVVVGSGSEGIMSNIVRTFLLDDDEVLTSEGTFVGIRVLTQGRGVRLRTVPPKNWGFDLEAIAAAISDKTKIVYLANPNNPTGTIFTRQEFDSFYRHVPERVLIILDEAYFEYASANPRYPDSMHYRYDNVITLRTFSKIHGLAGVRIGYGFAHDHLIANLNKIKLPFEPSSLAQAAGVAALGDREFVLKSLEVNARGLRYLAHALRDLGLSPIASEANFVFVPMETEARAKQLFQGLLEQGVIVRHTASFGLPEGLRITAGTEEEIRELIRCLKQVLVPIAA